MESGRAWTVPELRHKTWSDLHSLWWVCVRERNRLATAKHEMLRLEIGFGLNEIKERDEVVCRCIIWDVHSPFRLTLS